jgi:NADP-dependent 3-hydroxy acid dehydrogenase YdfG
MEQSMLHDLFSLRGKVAVVTGATGVLGGAMARSLARCGARVAVLGRREERARRVAEEIEGVGGEALALPTNVLDRARLEDARDALLERWDKVDILVNAAGGNVPAATLSDDVGVFRLPENAVRQVIDLNFLGTLLPCQVFGAAMVEGSDEPDGCIVNVSSMAASRPLTNVVGYSAAKAAVENFTRWLAVELARTYGQGLSQGQRHGAGFLYRGAEQGPPARGGRQPLAERTDHNRAYPGGAFRRTRRVGRNSDLALQQGCRLRQRDSGAR